ncbi:MAG: D-tyrosyl-tRNA(Tyr) deacylase [Bacteroidetes bacterium 43-16]|nr:MAG: D-tyrosyl-tRNA(Tyr) deacylase [Bacteroidetes bacterium 43-16]
MKLVIQRVKKASVSIGGKVHSSIEQGLLVLAGISHDDTSRDLEYAANKLVQLRICADENGVMNRSVKDVDGAILVVSQFTLLAQTRKGNRPSYIAAARPEVAIPLYEQFCQLVTVLSGKAVATGVFGADMEVALINDGPVTIVLDSREK